VENSGSWVVLKPGSPNKWNLRYLKCTRSDNLECNWWCLNW
jgi:hypothetical protein